MQIILTITTFLTITSVILTSNSERNRNKNDRDRERDDRGAFLSRNWKDSNGNSGNWRRDERQRGREDTRFNENERIRRSDRDHEREDSDKRIGRGRGRPEYEDTYDHKINPKPPKYPINAGGEPNKIISPPPFFPFPTEPPMPKMPSIIKPYPVIESQSPVYVPVAPSYVPVPPSYVVVPPNYYSSSYPSEYYPTVTLSPIYSAKYSQEPEVVYTTPVTSVYSNAYTTSDYSNAYTSDYSNSYTSSYSNAYTSSYSNAYTSSNSNAYTSASYYPISSSIAKKVPVYYNSTTSISPISYDSTYIKTEAESTVTTKVTGRYRAMSNSSSSSSSSQNSNIAGSISFSLVLLSSLFLLILV